MNESTDKNLKSSFEQAFYTALKKEGFLFPMSDKEVEEFEATLGSTSLELPLELNDPEKYAKDKVVKILPNRFINSQLDGYQLKVAAKQSRKKKKS